MGLNIFFKKSYLNFISSIKCLKVKFNLKILITRIINDLSYNIKDVYRIFSIFGFEILIILILIYFRLLINNSCV
ncbi:hypothetical protein A0H76_1730 [Hepatospora eriocheir]|uniref:Uncharacterized protein n=1 Tax=Hepatospora eriocheir TaxID=1081669 RepID=A0A1X0QKI9_9MICR|nr:hypothetical protein A0H76_1730 [Hepatospora eriocheir]